MRTALPIVAAAFATLLTGAASAGSMMQSQSVSTQSALLFHGNYCGPGNRGPNVPPVDALDTACMHHDACTPSDGLPHCSCHGRLRVEATRIVRNPRQPDDLRTLAQLVAQGSEMLACKPDTSGVHATVAP